MGVSGLRGYAYYIPIVSYSEYIFLVYYGVRRRAVGGGNRERGAR